MNLLVTGATSFLGSAVCRELLSRGHRVFAPVRKTSANLGALPDSPELRRIFVPMEEIGGLMQEGIPAPDACIHFAWSGVGVRGRMDPEIQEQNLSRTMELIRTAAAMGCRRFLFAGSQAEYGVTLERVREGSMPGGPVPETTECRPVSLYGQYKLRVLREGGALAVSLGMEYCHMRIFSVYGPGDHGTSLVSSCVRAAAAGGTSELGPCAQQWNFLHVRDCAAVIAALSEKRAEEKHGKDACPGAYPEKAEDNACSFAPEVYNIGSRDTRQLRDFAEEIFEIAGTGSVRFTERAAGPEGTPWLFPDISRVTAVTGTEPAVSFREGIREMLPQRRDASGT